MRQTPLLKKVLYILPKNLSYDIWLDEIVPCLRDVESGEIKETVVFEVRSRSFLKILGKIMVGELIGVICQKM